MKWTTKKVLDQVTCSIGLFIRKYYFKSYIIVNEIIAEGVFSIHSPRLAYCDKNKEKFPECSILPIQNFLSR